MARRVALLVAVIVALASATSATVPDGDESSRDPVALIAGQTLELAAERGMRHLLRFEAPGATRWLLRLDQLGADGVVTLRPPSGVATSYDSPLDRDGVELLLLPLGARGGEVEVEVRVASSRPGGRFRVRLEELPTTEDAAALEAWTRAAAAYGRGGGPGLRQALDDSRRAAELWQVGRRPRLAAQALYAVAVLHRLLGEDSEARSQAERVLPLWRSFGDLGREADTLNEIGLVASRSGELDLARTVFRQALALQERAGDGLRQAATVSNLCLTYLQGGEHARADDCYGEALETIRQAGDTESEAVARTNRAWALSKLGRPGEALASYRQAAQLHQDEGRAKRRAETLNLQAVLHRNLDEPLEALRLYLEALEIFRREGDRRWQARVVHNLGSVYLRLGDLERSRVFLRHALDLRRQLEDRPGEATSWHLLGMVELTDGDAVAALAAFERAMNLELATGDRHGAAVTRSSLALAGFQVGNLEVALAEIDRALATLRDLGDPRYQARALLTRGQIQVARGRYDPAEASLEEAAEGFRRLAMASGESDAWLALAAVARGRGDLEGAIQRVDRALALLDGLRTELGSPDLQSLFLGSRSEAHRLRIDLLMTLAERLEDPSWIEEALLTSERWRAIGLRGLLAEPLDLRPGGGGGAGPSDALREARRATRLLAAQLRRERARVDSGGSGAAAEAARLEVELARSVAALESLEAGAWAGGSSRLEEALDVAGLHRALDAETALLEVVLGRERGFGFVVARQGLEVFETPSRAIMEDLARRYHHELVSTGRADGHAATTLARILVEPTLARLADLGAATPENPFHRLAVVSDGALHYVPLGALPLPQGEGAPARTLLERYEVVRLASVSALVAERRRSQGRSLAPRWAAVLADPVFDAQDPRARTGREVGGSTDPEGGPVPPEEALSTLRQGLGVELPRLRRSRQEAQQIAALASPGEVLVALDFEARRELVLGGSLADYQIVHFATHGVIDTRHPALSGLALSRVDPRGEPVDGFLELRDLSGMRLQADLVVLSACQTALGREVRGEGLVGFTQAFLQAGARRVVASLWSVPDHATAELMARFYGALVEHPDAPTAALRQAQLSMAGERRWRDPRNWAAWVLVGDWRSHRTEDTED